MEPQPLSYQAREKPKGSPTTVKSWAVGVAALVLSVNVYLVASAVADRSWGALAIAIIIGPMTNVAILLVSLVLTPLVRFASRGASVTPYVLTSMLAPVAAILIDGACILPLDLHGC